MLSVASSEFAYSLPITKSRPRYQRAFGKTANCAGAWVSGGSGRRGRERTHEDDLEHGNASAGAREWLGAQRTHVGRTT